MPAHHFIQRRNGQPTSVRGEDSPSVTNTAQIGEETMILDLDSKGDNKGPTIKNTEQGQEVPTEISAPSSSSSVKPVLEVASGTAAAPADGFGQTQTNLPQNDKPASNSDESSTSAGAKAGIAFGVIGAALLLGCIIFFYFGRRKRQAMKSKKSRKPKSPVDSEKQAGQTSPKPAVVRTLATDVAAANRPVTTFFPGNQSVNKPLPDVEDLAPPMAAALAPERRARTDSRLWNRPVSNASTNLDNPFGLHAERLPSPERYPTPSRSPSPILVNESLPRDIPVEEYQPAAAVAPLAPLARKASLRKNGVPKFDLSMPAPPKMPAMPATPSSPAMTEYSVSAAPAAAATDSDLPNSTVHRVQQDFEPTMSDEMELKAGQLVRLLHEFDDGWVSFILHNINDNMTNQHSRLCASVLTCPSKELSPGLVSPPAR